jgi:hypothetical protein
LDGSFLPLLRRFSAGGDGAGLALLSAASRVPPPLERDVDRSALATSAPLLSASYLFAVGIFFFSAIGMRLVVLALRCTFFTDEYTTVVAACPSSE